jgi:DNA-directed RNA polymerase subunit RPC12/RpoP
MKPDIQEDKLLELCSVMSVAEADRIKALLESNGVRVFLIGDNTASVAPHHALATGGVKVMVPSSQIARASDVTGRAVKNLKTPTELARAAENGEVECPECGGNRIVYGRGLSWKVLVPMILLVVAVAFIPILPKRYICQSCGHKWYP